MFCSYKGYDSVYESEGESEEEDEDEEMETTEMDDKPREQSQLGGTPGDQEEANLKKTVKHAQQQQTRRRIFESRWGQGNCP
jgi:hypothetical protein